MEDEMPQTIVHLISDFVIELLETLDIPEEQINELGAKLQLVTTVKQPEELLVHLCSVGEKIMESASKGIGEEDMIDAE